MVLDMLFPLRCVRFSGLVESDHGPLGLFWCQSYFIIGLNFWISGQPLIGNIDVADEVLCSSCLLEWPIWWLGVVALSYSDNRRALGLALKYGDWHHIVFPAVG